MEQKLAKLKETISSQKELKIVLGSAGIKVGENWILTDKNVLDMTNKDHWERLFEKDSIDNLMAEHVFEHLEIDKIKMAFDNVYDYLKLGGVLRFATPDGHHPSEYYKRFTKPGGEGPDADEHKVFFTIDLLQEIINHEKFDVIPIEYCDKNGIFHKSDYSADNGPIIRTAQNYPCCFFTDNPEEYREFYGSIPEHLREQFEKNNYTYTSLFVDLIKK